MTEPGKKTCENDFLERDANLDDGRGAFRVTPAAGVELNDHGLVLRAHDLRMKGSLKDQSHLKTSARKTLPVPGSPRTDAASGKYRQDSINVASMPTVRGGLSEPDVVESKLYRDVFPSTGERYRTINARAHAEVPRWATLEPQPSSPRSVSRQLV